VAVPIPPPMVTSAAGHMSLAAPSPCVQAGAEGSFPREVTTMTMHLTWTLTGVVDDVYRPGAITASADESLEQIAADLQAKEVSALVVLDGYRLAGIITERDIVRAVADGRKLADCTAAEYMAPEPATVDLETPLGIVAWKMLAFGVRHLPVLVGGEVTGMVSARDLLELQIVTK
jgi:CBS domain-containing protein